jgi:hypothetical protein
VHHVVAVDDGRDAPTGAKLLAIWTVGAAVLGKHIAE